MTTRPENCALRAVRQGPPRPEPVASSGSQGPGDGTTKITILFAVARARQPPPNPRDKIPGLPDTAAQAVIWAMAKKPTERFNTAGGFFIAMADGT